MKKQLTQIITIMAIISIFTSIMTGCSGSGNVLNTLSGTYFLGSNNSEYISKSAYIQFNSGNKVEIADSGVTYSGTYKLNGNTVKISHKLLGTDCVDTYTVSDNFKSLSGDGRIYKKEDDSWNDNKANNSINVNKDNTAPARTLSSEYYFLRDNESLDYNRRVVFYSDGTFSHSRDGIVLWEGTYFGTNQRSKLIFRKFRIYRKFIEALGG